MLIFTDIGLTLFIKNMYSKMNSKPTFVFLYLCSIARSNFLQIEIIWFSPNRIYHKEQDLYFKECIIFMFT